MDTNGFNPSVRKKVILLGRIYVPPQYLISKIWRMPDYRKDIRYNCNIHISSLASLTEQQAKKVISIAKVKPILNRNIFDISVSYFNTDFVLAAINYPLKRKYILTIKPSLDTSGNPISMHIGYFLWQVARAYRDEIYAFPHKYGVWGHQLDDLWFESIVMKKVSPRRYYALIEIGS